VLIPEVQAKAQGEIDSVVDKDGLLGFDDTPALPYLEAVLRETLRWHNSMTMGVPYATTTSDTCNCYLIPEG
ncbi:hypothetical protein CY34DRAFT_69220, partial [Suillus luteus UH-Slu-Lm8-n1]